MQKSIVFFIDKKEKRIKISKITYVIFEEIWHRQK